ncbi:CHAT domain-containing tetratricopeptide repeat protein [Leptolyngbya sp. 'hensonii']|uniref:CHAT domain-containing protein n=1 Tax=Leptolyngbya sp. 'hensonii' TaxID=1922337 RepID=UPI0011810774|nr:CHAT domain-containing tetratricopeptide repeat protein [Leptolyngbya sp. 'hensonii']
MPFPELNRYQHRGARRMNFHRLSRHGFVAGLVTVTIGLSSLVPLQAQSPDTLKTFYQQTIDTFDKNLTAARQSKQRWQEVDVLNGAGIAYRYFGNYQKSVEVLQQGLTIAREIKDAGREDLILRELAATYSKLGDYLGIKFYEQQLQSLKSSGNSASRGAILRNLGLAYLQSGNFLKVIEVYEQYVPIVRQGQNPLEEEIALSILGAAYRTLGEKGKAAAILEQRLALARQTKNSQTEFQILSELAVIYQYSNQSQKALALYQQMLQTARQSGNRTQESNILYQLALLYTSLNNLPQAQTALEQELAIVRQGNDLFTQGLVLEGLSQVRALGGNLEAAIDLQQQAIAAYRSFKQDSKETNPSAATALGRLGLLQFRARQFPEAETTLQASLREYQAFLAQVLGNANLFAISRDDLNLSLREQLSDIYRTLQQIYLAQNRSDTALEAAEEGRARAFIELLAGGKSSPEAIKLATIQQVAKAQQATLVEYTVLYDSSPFAQFRSGNQQPQETGLLIWVVRPDGTVTFRQVNLKRGAKVPTLADQIISTRGSIGAGNRGFSFNEDPNLVRDAIASTGNTTPNAGLRQLYELLIQPVADQLPQDPKARVIFIPQDSLFLVPFPALQDASGRYLIEKHTILTAPAIQVLQATRKPSSSGNVLVVGNPTMPTVRFQIGTPPQQLASLPGAEREAQAIGALFNTQPLLGKQATETTVTTRMPQARIIHLATHGLLDRFIGFQSALAFAPSGQEDGLLTARELLNLKLTADLVVLSACDTGRGRISGDGVVGLSRSLLSAGAATVIVSLWKVPDTPTAFLMTEFYRNLNQGSDKAQSLRQAMLATLKQYPSPQDWAAFTLIGQAE